MAGLEVSNVWQTAVVLASVAVGISGFVQTVINIAKSRYELRKLKVEDEQLRRKKQPPETPLQPLSEKPLINRKPLRSVRRRNVYDRLDYDLGSLVRWIVMTAFLTTAGLIYMYMTVQEYHSQRRIKDLRGELAFYREANAAMDDALSLIRRSIEARNRGKVPFRDAIDG